jgi:TetR/AcrR family transcriptional regulator, cholesterol catabolism regulator
MASRAKKAPGPRRPGRLGQPRGSSATEDRVDEVIEVATRLFCERGFRATRLDDISNALGVTRAALYYYFDGKSEVLEEICARAMLSSETALRQIQVLDDPVDRLVAFAKVFASNMNSDAARVFTRDNSELKPTSRRALMARAYAVNEGAEAIFRYGIERGDFSSEIHLRHTTLGFLGMLRSMANWYRPSRDGDFDDTVEDLVRVFISGVMPRPAVAPRKRVKAA